MKRKVSIFLLLAVLLTFLVLPAQATELSYVTDAANLLSYEEWDYLETLCGDISDQYNCGVYVVTVDDFTLNKGDFVLRCHIPSGGPLKPELCRESFQIAYEFFTDRLKDGILPIVCRSWLLYPDYTDVFGENSNTVDFAKNFKIISVHETEGFDEAWRVFGVDYEGDVSKLPTDTTLQRNFIEYIKEGKAFGGGTGVLLFDGKEVLTRR